MGNVFTLVCLIGGIFALIIHGAVSAKFNEIAGEKGYDGYTLWCFFLGIAGWLMVVALPDKYARNNNIVNTSDNKPNDELPTL